MSVADRDRCLSKSCGSSFSILWPLMNSSIKEYQQTLNFSPHRRTQEESRKGSVHSLFSGLERPP